MNHIYKKPPVEKTATDQTAGNIYKNKGSPHPKRTRCWFQTFSHCSRVAVQEMVEKWFQTFFVFTPILGEIIQFDLRISFFKWVGSTTREPIPWHHSMVETSHPSWEGEFQVGDSLLLQVTKPGGAVIGILTGSTLQGAPCGCWDKQRLYK